MVSAAIYGDGAACCCYRLKKETKSIGPKNNSGERHVFILKTSTQMMRFDLTNEGLKMILDPEVPAYDYGAFFKIIHPFYSPNTHRAVIEQVDHLIFHPGERKIVQTVERVVWRLGKKYR